MPAALFPRTLLPNSISPLSVPSGLVSVGHTGKAQLRAVVSMGRSWTETWAALRSGDANVEGLLAWIEWAYNNSITFGITHLTTRGSGRAPLSGGFIGAQVLGGGQTGEVILTDGWTPDTTNIMRAGDVIRISGVSPLLRITQDLNSTGLGQSSITVNPPIPVGSSPADNAAVTTVDNPLVAYIASPPNLPDVTPGYVFAGMSLTFREAV